MPVKLIIFDLDGTLIDSSIDITNAINYAIEPYGVKPITIEETISLVGEGITRLMEKIVVSHQPSAISLSRDLLVERFLDYYSAHLVDRTTVYPGVRETLERLKDYKKAVISNKREALSTKILNDLGLLKYLDLVVGSDTTPERKPSPIPILHVLSKLNIKPEDAVIVGDSNFDIEAGKAAGIKTIAVTYGYRPLDLLKGADFIINRMDKLLDILRRFE
ncbi:MAG: HAD family hydrolase [Nitrospirota bacterium]